MAMAMTHYIHPNTSAFTICEAPEMSALQALTLPLNSAPTAMALVSPNSTPRGDVPSSVVSTVSTCPLVIANESMISMTSASLVIPNDGINECSSPSSKPRRSSQSPGTRLNKFVRRLHDMLQKEQNSGIVEWRRGLLVLHSTDAFAKTILPRYFNTRNFKTFRRQLNYYGFVHVRSFSTTGSTTTALWVNRDLAENGTADITTVLQLKRVEPCESAKTSEGRRVRKELAVSTVEDEIGVSGKILQLEHMRHLLLQDLELGIVPNQIPLVVHCSPEQSQPSALRPLASPMSWSASDDHAVSDNSSLSDNDDDAANLLMMLSKSTVNFSAMTAAC